MDSVKQKLLQYAKNQKIGMMNFYKKTAISQSNFSGDGAESALSTDKIINILINFPDLNPDWLLLGKGEMLRSEAQKTAPSSAEAEKIWKEILADKENKIEALIRENERLRLQLEHLKKKAASSSDETALV